MKITEQEKQRRKERIIQIAFQLFCEKGIEKVTLVDIAKKARVGETTIYRYFTNKPQLVLQTISVLWKEIGISLEEKAEATENYKTMTGFEQLKVRLEGCKKLYLENADYVLFSYETKLYLQRNQIQLTQQQYDGLMYEIKKPCIAALDKGKADGSIPTIEDSEDLFYAIWGAIRGYVVKIVIYEALCRDGSPWEKRYDILEEGLLCALKSGWKLIEDMSY